MAPPPVILLIHTNIFMLLTISIIASTSLAPAAPTLVSAQQLPASRTTPPPKWPPNFTFYLHIRVYNPAVNNSVFNSVYSAGPFNFSQPNPYSFGVRSTFEAPITAGSTPETTQIGVAQGVWVLDSQKGLVLMHMFTATIKTGAYTGSIVIMGQIDEALETRTLAVVGGTGDFLAARGAAVNKLVVLDHGPPAHWTLSFDLDLYY